MQIAIKKKKKKKTENSGVRSAQQTAKIISLKLFKIIQNNSSYLFPICFYLYLFLFCMIFIYLLLCSVLKNKIKLFLYGQFFCCCPQECFADWKSVLCAKSSELLCRRLCGFCGLQVADPYLERFFFVRVLLSFSRWCCVFQFEDRFLIFLPFYFIIIIFWCVIF